MNIAQTQQLLSFLWSKFPSARNLSAEDRHMTTLAYFDELWSFSLPDALAGARRAVKAKPSFMPSAPEIASQCVRTILPDEQLVEERRVLKSALVGLENQSRAYWEKHSAELIGICSLSQRLLKAYQGSDVISSEDKALLKKLEPYSAAGANIDKEIFAVRLKIEDLERKAIGLAKEAYDSEQRRVAAQDFKKLGWGVPESTESLEG